MVTSRAGMANRLYLAVSRAFRRSSREVKGIHHLILKGSMLSLKRGLGIPAPTSVGRRLRRA